MRLSAKTEYASLAMLELARRQHDEEPVRIREIADAHGVPSRFLVQILLQLKAAGLARDAAAITLADIREVIEGGGELVSALRSDASQSRASEVLLDAWQEAARCERDTLCSLDLATLAARTEVAPEGMYYI
jgi:Rrf2 family protein